MKVLIQTIDSGTQELEEFETEIGEFDGETVAAAIDTKLNSELEDSAPNENKFKHEVKSFITCDNEVVAAFIFTSKEDYFGSTIVSGLVYEI
jgi:hypothetical protein